MVIETEILIVGAGIAGAGAAYFLSQHRDVVVIEGESQPGYHTTGRSSAMFLETYGPPQIRALSRASRFFFDAPPADFTGNNLLAPRGALHIARQDQVERLQQFAEETQAMQASVSLLSQAEAIARVAVLRPDYVHAAALESSAMDIDVHALHQGFLHGHKQRGGRLICDCLLKTAAYDGKRWQVETSAGAFSAAILVNAAGAWVDEIAQICGVDPIGIQPKRRTAFLFNPPDDIPWDRWPVVVDIDEEFYFKPDAGLLLGTPADETLSPPCDAQAEDLDIAIAVDRLQKATTLAIPRIQHKRAGLRSFVDDKTPVVGFDQANPAFFWLAGQGGYGIQSAPAMGRLAASLVMHKEVPEDLTGQGVRAAALSPDRLQNRTTRV